MTQAANAGMKSLARLHEMRPPRAVLRSVLESQRVQAELRRLQERHDHLSAQLAGALQQTALQTVGQEWREIGGGVRSNNCAQHSEGKTSMSMLICLRVRLMQIRRAP